MQVSTGATEMGQGVNVKIRQLVADEFAHRREPRRAHADQHGEEHQHVADGGVGRHRPQRRGGREGLPNRSSGACAGSPPAGWPMRRRASAPRRRTCNSATAMCTTAAGRSDGSRSANFVPKPAANRVDLGARGFYATPGVDFNRETGQGTPFFYYTQGAAVAEVLVDRFTGELRVPRVDLLIDIGRSINPGVDRGQVIGGFIQGMGWVTTEALVYDAKGDLLSHSPTTYKIPAITDVPEVFNVATFDNNDNVRNVYRSKAVGEPPLMLGIAVWAAAKNALAYIGRQLPRPNCDCRPPAKRCCAV